MGRFPGCGVQLALGLNDVVICLFSAGYFYNKPENPHDSWAMHLMKLFRLSRWAEKLCNLCNLCNQRNRRAHINFQSHETKYPLGSLLFLKFRYRPIFARLLACLHAPPATSRRRSRMSRGEVCSFHKGFETPQRHNRLFFRMRYLPSGKVIFR